MVQAIIPEGRKDLPEYVQYRGLFSPPECTALRAAGGAIGFADAGIGGGNGDTRIDKSYRCVQTANMVESPSFDWFFDKLRRHIALTNRDFFNFDLIGLSEGVNILRYDAPTSPDEHPGHYDMHQDIGGYQMSLRKLSVVIQLSDPADYDGCRLTLVTHRHLEVPEIGQGDVIIFPSYLPHYVTPITRGSRYAIASWVSGPPFR